MHLCAMPYHALEEFGVLVVWVLWLVHVLRVSTAQKSNIQYHFFNSFPEYAYVSFRLVLGLVHSPVKDYRAVVDGVNMRGPSLSYIWGNVKTLHIGFYPWKQKSTHSPLSYVGGGKIMQIKLVCLMHGPVCGRLTCYCFNNYMLSYHIMNLLNPYSTIHQ